MYVLHQLVSSKSVSFQGMFLHVLEMRQIARPDTCRREHGLRRKLSPFKTSQNTNAHQQTRELFSQGATTRKTNTGNALWCRTDLAESARNACPILTRILPPIKYLQRSNRADFSRVAVAVVTVSFLDVEFCALDPNGSVDTSGSSPRVGPPSNLSKSSASQ